MGITKGAVLISYDIPTAHQLVKESMKRKGYLEKWNYPNQKEYTLPNTTLWKPDTSSDTAMQDLWEACAEARVRLEKAVAVLATDWVGH